MAKAHDITANQGEGSAASTELQPLQTIPNISVRRQASWIATIVVSVLAVGWYLLYANFDRPIRGVVNVEHYTATEGFGSLGREIDWNFAGISDDGRQIDEIELQGVFDSSTRFSTTSTSGVSNFAARLTDVFRLNDDEIFAVYNGYGVVIRTDGTKRELRLLEPDGLISKPATVSDAVVVDRTLSILIRGRLDGQQRGTHITFEIPDVDWSENVSERLVLKPQMVNRIDPPSIAATFIKESDDWATLTRDGLVRFSWGRSVAAPEHTRRLWSRNPTKLIAQTYHDSAVTFHELNLSREPLAFGPTEIELPPLRYSAGHAMISPDGRYALVMRNVFMDRNSFGLYWSKAITDFTLISLDDWLVRASSRESSQAWRATALNPYWQAAFTHDSRRLRLLRGSQQLETVDVNAWIEACGGNLP